MSKRRSNPDDRAQTEQAGLQVISIPQVNLHRETKEKEPRQYDPAIGAKGKKSRDRIHNQTYCSPNKLNVNSAMRIDSVFPLMDGEPTHLAACGIFFI